MPKVSVILSSYNHAPYVAEAVESVLNQTFRDFELLIYDDGSTDGSREIIRSIHDDRIRLFLYEENRGPLEAVKEPSRAMQGEYIAVHHSDDVWLPEKLEKQVRFLDEHPEYAACFAWADFIDENGQDYELPEGHLYKNKFLQKNRSREEWVHDLFYGRNCLCHPSLMGRREMYEEFRLLDVGCFWQLPDYLMWLRLCMRASIYIYPEILVKFRIRRGLQTSMSSANYRSIVRDLNENNEILREIPFMIQDDAFFFKAFPEAQEYLKGNRYNRAFAYAQICLALDYPPAMQAALQILYDLLQDETQRMEIADLYGYDAHRFIEDTGRYDVYGARWRNRVANSGLYVDQGQGLHEQGVWREPVYIPAGGLFAVRFRCSLQAPVRGLRFDPDEGRLVAMKITGITVNGHAVPEWTSNAAGTAEGFQYFSTPDPQYYLEYASDERELDVCICGEMRQDSEQYVAAALLAEIREMQSKVQEMQSKVQEMQSKMVSARWLCKSLCRELWKRVRRRLGLQRGEENGE